MPIKEIQRLRFIETGLPFQALKNGLQI